MIRKWLLTASLLIVGTATLFGCGKDDKGQTPQTTTTETTTSDTQASVDNTEAATESTPSSESTTEAPEEKTTAISPSKETPNEETTTAETLAPKVDKETKGTGIFNGQIDSNSIEVEMQDGSYETFFIYDEKVAEQFNNMDIGAKISFTYGPVKGQVNPEILSVTVQQ